MQFPVNIDLVVSPNARKISALQEKYSLFRLFMYPVLICLLLGVIIGQFGVDTPSGLSPVWMILLFSILGALIGVQFNLYAFFAGLFGGIVFGIYSQHILFQIHTLMQQKILLSIYQIAGIELSSTLEFVHWCVLGLLGGAVLGLIRIAPEKHYRWGTLLLMFLGLILLVIIFFLGLPLLKSMQLF
jgi:hypothetical protein